MKDCIVDKIILDIILSVVLRNGKTKVILQIIKSKGKKVSANDTEKTTNPFDIAKLDRVKYTVTCFW